LEDIANLYQNAHLKLTKLADDMDKIGFLFEEKIRDLINEKKQ